MKTPSLLLIGMTMASFLAHADKPQKQATQAPQPSISFDFKSLHLGATEEELKARFPDFACRDPKDDRQRRMADRICIASPSISCQPNTWCENDPEKPWSYGGIRANNVIALFYAGRMHGISVNIHPEQYSPLVEALRIKYGKPANVEVELLQTRLGASYENQKTTWENQDTTIVAAKYTNSINNGTIRYQLKSSIEEFAKRSIQTRNKAADQL